MNARTENQEQPDGGLPGVPHEPIKGRDPLADRLVHHVTELHAADEDPGGGGPALQLVHQREQEVRERGVQLESISEENSGARSLASSQPRSTP